MTREQALLLAASNIYASRYQESDGSKQHEDILNAVSIALEIEKAISNTQRVFRKEQRTGDAPV